MTTFRNCFLALVISQLSITFGREILSPPYIVKQPPTGDVFFRVKDDGENKKPFIIECEANGNPAPRYRWAKNGTHFDWQAHNNRISQQPGRGTLFISDPQDLDVGQYQCFAENEHGVATSNSVFMRKAKLNFFKETEPILLTGHEGQPFKFECNPPDSSPKPRIYWIYLIENGGLKSINSSRITSDPEGNLWFSNLTKSDSSMYGCAATAVTEFEYTIGNKILLNVQSTTASGALTRLPPVLQYVTERNKVALRGKRVELYCIFGGTPLPQTVWKKNGAQIISSDRITQGNYGKSLAIKAVDFNDEGSYMCEVSNGIGKTETYLINLKIISVPYFTIEPKIVNATEGESIEFKCEASGVPKPEIEWIFNGKLLQDGPSNPRRIIKTNKIIINNIKSNDTGNYGCNATNSVGYVYKDVYVNVLDKFNTNLIPKKI